jgi:hypothetical protein
VTTLGAYIDWLRSIGGRSSTGIAADPIVGMVPVTKLVSPTGVRRVIHPGGDRDERLSAAIIEQLDRRLEVLSPFRSTERS